MKLPLSRRQNGLSLIELLISLALGLVLLLGALEVFVRSSQTYRMQDALAEMQENARFAFNILFTDLRMSGFIGCGSLHNITPANLSVANYSLDNVVKGYQHTAQGWNPNEPAELTSNDIEPFADSDIISILSADTCSSALTADMAAVDSDIAIDTANSCGFTSNDIVIISDCNSANLVKLSSAPSNGTVSHPGLTTAYSQSAEMMRLKSVSYFVAIDPNGGVPSLYMFNHNLTASSNNPIALFEGIESMQIRYGTDETDSGVPNTFKDAHDVDDWAKVLSVQITLLTRSAGRLNASPYTLNVGGTNKEYSDGVLRKPFSATVKLRNRG